MLRLLRQKLLTTSLMIVVSCLTFLTLATTVRAQSNTDYFDTKLDTTVTVNEAGISRVKHEFTITNKTPTTFLSQYGLKISSDQLKNIAVVNDGEVIEPEVVSIGAGDQPGPGQTSIGITFPDKIVGEGKQRQFIISYSNPDAAVISGSVLEVTLPPQANPEDYSSYTITLITPDSFGGPIRTTPENRTFTVSGSQVATTFQQGGEAGVFALFGAEQVFDLDIEYQLDNSNNNPAITQIALPPDTSYQKIHYQQLEPRPEKIESDADGNWIATYQLPAATDTHINLTATVQLNLEPNPDVPIIAPAPELLSAQEYWPVENERIQALAQEYTSPAAINQYVVNALSYNTTRALNQPSRLGALAALDLTDQAVCQEFTDLFVSVARGAGIHTRRVTGFAYSQNNELRPLSLVEDVLHAWPEYYDAQQQRWIPIDPTWEDTTGGVDYFHQVDLNHIVFAINGHDSQVPYPAGSYKPIGSTDKTVNVSFGIRLPEIEPAFEYQLQSKKLFGVNLPGQYTLKITNVTGQAHYQLPFALTADQSQLITSFADTSQISVLPFQTIEIPLQLEHPSQFLPEHDTIQLTLNNESQVFDVTTGPPLRQYLEKQHLFLGLAIILISATLVAGSILVFQRRAKNTLRRQS